MSIETAIERFRTKQAEQFSDTGTLHRPVGEPTTDPDTGAVTQDYDEVYDALPGKIRPAERRGSDIEAGETEVRVFDMTGKYPVDSDIRHGDIYTVTASTYDATMVGRQYRVAEAPADAWQIAKVISLEETLVPLDEEGS